MTGKVPNLAPSAAGFRLKGLVTCYWSPFFQRYITKSTAYRQLVDSPKRAAMRKAFSTAVKVIKTVPSEDVIAAEQITKNTPFLVRDVLMMAAYGRLIDGIDETGQSWVSIHMANATIEQYLDSITTTKGAMLVRTTDGWVGLIPGTANQVLTLDATTGIPDWEDSQGGGGGSGYPAGTPPKVVQVAHNTSGLAATFDAAPTEGNLLVAFSFNSATDSLETGWTQQAIQTSGTDYGQVCTKTAGASESTTQQSINSTTASGGCVIYELSGATTGFVAGTVGAEVTAIASTPQLLPGVKDCIGLSVVAVVTGHTISEAYNLGTQNVLDNSGNRNIAAGQTDLSQTPMVGAIVLLSGSGNSKSASALIGA